MASEPQKRVENSVCVRSEGKMCVFFRSHWKQTVESGTKIKVNVPAPRFNLPIKNYVLMTTTYMLKFDYLPVCV